MTSMTKLLGEGGLYTIAVGRQLLPSENVVIIIIIIIQQRGTQ